MKSIRRSLLLSLFLGVLVSLGGAAYAVFHELTDEVNELFDAQLIQASYAVPHNLLPETDAALESDDDPNRQLVIAVWEGDAGQPTYRSRTHVSLVRPKLGGFNTETVSGDLWRTYVRVAPNRVIEVAQPLEVRTEAALNIAQRLAMPVVMLIPLMALVVWYLVSRGLTPLTRFAKELKTRSPTALQSIPAGGLPAELSPMAVALNDLMRRLEQVLAAQKNFIGDAAHEILTPLTALQVQVQVLERAKTEERQAQAMHDVRASLERCVNLARQLLALARNSAEIPHASLRAVDLGALARRAVEEALPKARDRQIDLGVLAPAPLAVTGDEFALQVLLRNLVDNAIKYSAVGGRVDVAINFADEPRLIVSDTGPGVPPEERARLFDRFYRGSNPDVDGTGLGLAIVKEIAERHYAEIELESPGVLGGLDVIVRFPRMTAAQVEPFKVRSM